MAKPTKGAPEPRQKFTVRALHEADPGYAGLAMKRQELRNAVARLNSAEADTLFKLGDPSASRASVSSRVAELVGDPVDAEDPAPKGLRALLIATQVERRDVEAALRIVEERLAKARHAASRAVCDEVEPTYRERVAALAAALASAHDAHAAVVDVLDALDRADIARRPLFDAGRAAAMLGAPGDVNGRMAAWFREVTAAGLVDKSTVPGGLA